MGPRRKTGKILDQQYSGDENKHRKIQKEKKVKYSSSGERDEAQGKTQKVGNKSSRKKTVPALGRPKQTETIQVLDDPTASIQQCFLQYLDSIGLKHGLVFRPDERKILKQQGKYKYWNEDHQWNQEKQRQKIKSNKKIIGSIESIVASQKDQKKREEKKELYLDTMINIGDISAEECTSEIYLTVSLAFDAITNQFNQQTQKSKALELLKEFIFLSGNFTDKKIKYWIELKEQSKIQSMFEDMFLNLVKQIDQLLKNQTKLKQFFKEQRQMNLKLMEIQKGIFKKAK